MLLFSFFIPRSTSTYRIGRASSIRCWLVNCSVVKVLHRRFLRMRISRHLSSSSGEFLKVELVCLLADSIRALLHHHEASCTRAKVKCVFHVRLAHSWKISLEFIDGTCARAERIISADKTWIRKLFLCESNFLLGTLTFTVKRSHVERNQRNGI